MSKEEIVYKAIVETIKETKEYKGVSTIELVNRVLSENKYEEIKSFQLKRADMPKNAK